jgi:hypothetical protein
VPSSPVATPRLAGLTLAAALVLTAAAAISLAGIAWRRPPATRGALLSLGRMLPQGAVAHLRLLAQLDLAAGRPAAARRRLAAANRRSPFEGALWLDRATAALHEGRIAEAGALAVRGASFAPADPEACRRAAMILLQANDRPAAAPLLRCVLEHGTRRQSEAVLDLAHEVYGNDALVVQTVVPPDADHLRRSLSWAYSHRLVAAAEAAWTALEPLRPAAADRLRHIDFLLSMRAIAAADRLWTAAYGPRGKGIVFDGGFEGEPIRTGFGWRLGEAEGVRVAVTRAAAVRDARGLSVEFLGGNPTFGNVCQVVPVAGGHRYRLTAFVTTDGITSLSGPRLRVDAHTCPGMSPVESADLRGTLPWHPIALEFRTPEDCASVFVRVVRRRTERLDRNISGRFFLDEVSLEDFGRADATP